MKKFVAIAAVCLFAVAALGVVAWTVAEQCYQPSSSTKACYDPDDVVADCGDILLAGMCNQAGGDPLYIYEIEQFPDGKDQASSGATKTEATNCWRRRICDWDTEEKKCVTYSIWQVWRQKQKVVDNPNVQCPTQ